MLRILDKSIEAAYRAGISRGAESRNSAEVFCKILEAPYVNEKLREAFIEGLTIGFSEK